MFHRDFNDCGPRAAFQFMRRFGGGAPGFGPFGRGFGGPRGGGFRFGRMLRDGELRLVALALLEEAPRHGYDIIKALEERSNGFYSPSPGVVYPTLTYLEEAGYATAASEGNKKVYSISDAGKVYLGENRETVQAALEEMARLGARMSKAREWFEWTEQTEESEGPEVTATSRGTLDRSRRRLRALILAAIEGTEADQKRVAEILDKAADEILGQSKKT
jgi:DNA-binding PadR family transcriptional regulator